MAGPAKGSNAVIFSLFIGFLAASGDHIFARIDTVFAPDDVIGWD